MRILFIGDIVGKPGHRVVTRAVPLLRRRDELDLVIANAVQRLQDILNGPGEPLADAVIDQIYREVPGLLPRETFGC